VDRRYRVCTSTRITFALLRALFDEVFLLPHNDAKKSPDDGATVETRRIEDLLKT
jgi:hypothetical protein